MRLIQILKDLETSNSFPLLSCPYCAVGNLEANSTSQIKFTSVSSQEKYGFTGEPTDLISEYAFELICNNSQCEQKGIVVGRCNNIESGYDDGVDNETGETLHDGFPTYNSRYKIDFISLPIKLIEIPDDLPKPLMDCIESSYKLFWIDLNSCGNRIRSALEILLDHMNVPSKGTLNQRIELLEKDTKNPHSKLATKIMAIKYFGNESTHTLASIEKDDIIKSYKVLEFCLHAIFSKNKEQVEKYVNELNTKFNPKK